MHRLLDWIFEAVTEVRRAIRREERIFGAPAAILMVFAWFLAVSVSLGILIFLVTLAPALAAGLAALFLLIAAIVRYA